MKVLYAIQGTGNGHLSRARDVIPILRENCDLTLLVSGSDGSNILPYPVKYNCKGLGFIFGKKGGVDLVATYKKSNLKNLYREIHELPVNEYDLVINDFEPVSAWACHIKNLPCISLSHQAAVINKNSPRPKHRDIIGSAILKHYAPVTASYGFHFKAYDKNIFTPVIRQQLRNMQVSDKGHYTVYLPAYDDKRIIKLLKECKTVEWEVFSKHSKKSYSEKNINVYTINNDAFLKSLASCTGILCGAGFETPAEALFMKKKLMVIPMKGQFEQQCNAAALGQMLVPVIKSLKKKHLPVIQQWIKKDMHITVDYPDNLESIVKRILSTHGNHVDDLSPGNGTAFPSLNKFRKNSLDRILYMKIYNSL